MPQAPIYEKKIICCPFGSESVISIMIMVYYVKKTDKTIKSKKKHDNSRKI